MTEGGTAVGGHGDGGTVLSGWDGGTGVAR